MSEYCEDYYKMSDMPAFFYLELLEYIIEQWKYIREICQENHSHKQENLIAILM